MAKLSDRGIRILRWLGVLAALLLYLAITGPLTYVVALAFFFFVWLPVGVVFGVLVYLIVRLTPSRHLLVALLATGGLCGFPAVVLALLVPWWGALAALWLIACPLVGALLAWPRLTRRWKRRLAWLAAAPVAATAAATTLLIALMVRESEFVPTGQWVLADPVIVLGIAASLWWGVGIAPSRRPKVVARFTVVLAVVLVALCTALLQADLVHGLVVSLLGTSLGGLLVWRLRLATGQEAAATGLKLRRYKGMAPFQDTAHDRRTFFGRDRECRSLLSLVLAERLVVLFGKSGMGKTSLINVGLVEPLRRRGYFPMTVRLNDRERGPLGSLLDGIRNACRTAGVELLGGDETSAWHFFKSAEFWVGTDLLRPVLILDQFEELFTLHEAAARHRFVRQLAELTRGVETAAGDDRSPPDLKIVLSLREDFLADLQELAHDIPAILRHRFRISPMTAEAARQAIVGPAALPEEDFETVSFTYSEAAVEQILAFLSKRHRSAGSTEGEEVEPTHLQLVCQYLEERVGSREAAAAGAAGLQITAADLGGESSLQQVLEGFYDRTLNAIAPSRLRRRVRRLCEKRLIGGGGRRLTEDGEEISRSHGVPEEQLRELVDARLLRAEPRLGGTFYELSHDTLVEPISRSRARRELRQRVAVAVGALFLLAWFGSWWALGGQAAIRQAQVTALVDVLGSPLPRPGDEDVFLDLANERLDLVGREHAQGVRSREIYGALLVALDDVERLFRQLDVRRSVRRSVTSRVDGMREDVDSAFLREHGLKVPAAEDDEALNRRLRVPAVTLPGESAEVAAFLIQQHEVTNQEYRRFDRRHAPLAKPDDAAVGMSWYEAVAYAGWLGGRLPSAVEWRHAAAGGNLGGDFGEPDEWVAFEDRSRTVCGLCSNGDDRPRCASCRPGLDATTDEAGFRVAFDG